MRLPSTASRNSLAVEIQQQHEKLLEAGPAISYLTERGISLDTIERFQLGYDGGSRIVIPYLTPAGPLHRKYRCMWRHDCKAEGHAKYTYDEGIDQHLYNPQTLIGADRAVIVEGELDAISVEQAGINCVAYPGAQTWLKQFHWRWCFDSLDEVIVVADGDTPRGTETQGVGEIAARQVAKSLRDALPDVLVNVVVLPVGQDSNSYIQEHGVTDFVERVGWI